MELEKIVTVHNIAIAAMVVVTLVALFKKGTLTDFLNAFNNQPVGHSGRKHTAFGFAVLVAYTLYKGFDKGYINESNIVSVIAILVGVVLLALALIDFKDVLKFKNGEKSDSNGQNPN